ncbi:hypothetical protein AO385_1588 [Moraxella catarrhalis]|uniref:Uncharacterized protein n=1 Tax=Moraxella catarrhalis TaxID=480 RepID=A0A198UG44_MORCA|nr:hypothetical protein AO384_2218 [Moraxella catarrhalis]OAU98662.1 hypothetical protein AO385_1588 [Moraxella catarrhalis]OAU99669.1 hypothetical protein AO383_0126 [Moraxella catarrhalis]OAV00136.1 hypothetical protein AO382_1614 [Moraxella catarrhalis]
MSGLVKIGGIMPYFPCFAYLQKWLQQPIHHKKLLDHQIILIF